MATVKSAIQETRDQLFVDHADGKYLSNVGSNLGIDRPAFGFANDAIWRAILRRLALDSRQVLPLFHDLMTIMFGPNESKVTVLSLDTLVGDEELSLIDRMNIPQLGTMIIDEGLATEETIAYSFRDPVVNIVELAAALTQAHTAVGGNISSNLRAAAAVGATALELLDTTLFPTAGFPYSMIVSLGEGVEEVVQLLGNDVGAATLGISALANAHLAATPTSRATDLVSVLGSGSVIKVGDSSMLPAEGLISVVQDYNYAGETRVVHEGAAITASTTLQITDGLAAFPVAPGPDLVPYFLELDTAGLLAETNLRIIIANAATTADVATAFRSVGIATSPGAPTAYEVRTGEIRSGTLSAGAALTATLESTLDVALDELAGLYIVTTGGTGPGQRRRIVSNTDGTSSVLTVDLAWSINPDATTTYELRIAPEVVEFDSNDVDTGTLQLAHPLKNTYATTFGSQATVTLMYPGADVRLSQVRVVPVDWDIFVTEHETIKIYIPDTVERNRLQDVSFLHNTLVSPTPTTLAVRAGGSGIGDQILSVVPKSATDTWPTSGVLNINGGGEYIAYYRQDGNHFTNARASDETHPVSGIPIGTTVLLVDNIEKLATFDEVNLSKTLILDKDGVPEAVTYTDLDLATNKVTLAVATTQLHADSITVHPLDGDQFYLVRPLLLAHAAAQTVDLYQPVYAGEALEDGRIYTATDHLYQGSFVYELFQRAIETAQNTLAENIAGPTELMLTQTVPHTSLEVRDASMFLTTGEFDVRVCPGGTSDETIDVTTVVRRRVVDTVAITAGGALGTNTMTVSNVGELPTPTTAPYGYRLIIDPNGVNEEIVIVESIAGAIVTIEGTFQITHGAEGVRLMADVVVLSEAVTYQHLGKIPYAQRLVRWPVGPLTVDSRICAVEEVRTWIDLVSAALFPPAGSYAYINFGRVVRPVESRIITNVAGGAVAILLEDSDEFPVVYPYFVDVGVGAGSFGVGTVPRTEQLAVSNNNTGTDTLTVNATRAIHRGDQGVGVQQAPQGEWVRYPAGEPLAIQFNDTETGGANERLLLVTGTRFPTKHVIGEPVNLSGVTSTPEGRAEEFPFYLPGALEDRLKFLFDRGRAAGVEVIIIRER